MKSALQFVASIAAEQINLATRSFEQGNTESCLSRLTQVSVLLDRMRALAIDSIEPARDETP